MMPMMLCLRQRQHTASRDMSLITLPFALCLIAASYDVELGDEASDKTAARRCCAQPVTMVTSQDDGDGGAARRDMPRLC